MEKELPCEIVTDLLPNYIDNKINKTTYESISTHLSNCEKCNEVFDNMNVPIASEKVDKKNIDFLKGIRKKSRNLLILFLFFH